MHRRAVRFASLWAMLASAAFFGSRAQADAPRNAVDVARAKVYPALVNITVVVREFGEGRAIRRPAGGSGVVVTPQGHVLTNYHVAGDTTRIICTMPDGEELEARVLAHDPLTDLSVLKLRTEKRPKGSKPLAYAKLGNSDLLRVGDTVIAMGNPLMLSSSLTVGVVSNPRRVFTDFLGSEMESLELDDDVRTGLLTRWIQHDALILPGNSGGPLVNPAGEVVGINELGGAGVGFAIPSNTAAKVLHQVLAQGRVRRGWLGLSFLPVRKLGYSRGALVSSVVPGSAGSRAGLAPGDIVTSIAGHPVSVRFFEQVPDLYQMIADLPVGKRVRIDYLRNGRKAATTAIVELMQEFAGRQDEVRRLGVTAREITAYMMRVRRLPTRRGVLVTGVRAGYPAEAAVPPIAEGDIITAVGNRATPTLKALAEAVAALPEGKTAVALRRKNADVVSIVRIKRPSAEEEGGELPKAWLGVRTQVLTGDLAAALNVGDVKGFRITEVYPETEAARAGLKAGDIITELNGEPLDASRPQDEEDLRRAIENLTVGDAATLTVLRERARRQIAVKLEATPASGGQARKYTQQEFEFTVRDMTRMDRIENRWPPDFRGLMVTEVVSGGWAQMAGLRGDDVILGLQGKPMADVASFEAEMKKILKAKPAVIRIFVRRREGTHFVFIQPDWDKIAR
ncbi:MAG: PDZ domain-containing protein [Chthonomonadales bacterium]